MKESEISYSAGNLKDYVVAFCTLEAKDFDIAAQTVSIGRGVAIGFCGASGLWFMQNNPAPAPIHSIPHRLRQVPAQNCWKATLNPRQCAETRQTTTNHDKPRP